MTIQLDRTTLIQEFNQKSHFASRGIADLEQRLNNRSGDEEQQEAERCILTALYSARAFLSKWLADDSDVITEDGLGEEGHYTLELSLSTRKAEGKAKALTMLIHSYVVATALYHFYTTMGYADAAKRFIEEASISESKLNTLIHSKNTTYSMMFTQFHQIKRDTLATITLDKAAMVREIECATYKLASSTVPDESVRDNMQVDVEESIDSTLIVSFMDKRAAEIEEMLLAFSDDDASTDVDDSSDDSPTYVFKFAIEKKFKKNLKVASRYMHNYIVTGSILDWHKTNGSQYSLANDNDMIVLKSKIVNLFRGEFVKGGYIPDMIHPTR